MNIEEAVAALGRGPLEEDALKRHVWPLFSRVLQRSERDVYLANHSLGRPLDRTAQDLGDSVAAWYAELGGAWGQWLADRERFRALVARLVGAARPDCIVPKSSSGQGLRAVLNAYDKPLRVVTTEGEFDSLDIILRTYRDHGRVSLDVVPARADGRFHIDDIAARVVRGVDLVVLSHVMFRTAQLIEAIEPLARHAHDARARLVLDVYHSAGVVTLDLHALKVDFAVGGSYKYLRGAPAPAGCTCIPRCSRADWVPSTSAGSRSAMRSPTCGQSRRSSVPAATRGSNRRRPCSATRRRVPAWSSPSRSGWRACAPTRSRSRGA